MSVDSSRTCQSFHETGLELGTKGQERDLTEIKENFLYYYYYYYFAITLVIKNTE